MTLTLTYDAELSRVRATASLLPAGTVTASLASSVDGIRWSVVRGAYKAPVTAGSLDRPADDYEFAADVENTYRLTAYDVAGLELGTTEATITPDLEGRAWLKVIARPFLNRPVIVQDVGDVERPERAGVHEVVGRSLPVVVSDLRSSRRFELRLLTETPAQARALDLAFAAGEPVYLHVPAAAEDDVPAGYFHVGSVQQRRPSRKSPRRIFSAPVVEIAAPAADVVGAAGTWTTVLAGFATWADLLAAKATWGDVLELVGTPEDVIVE